MPCVPAAVTCDTVTLQGERDGGGPWHCVSYKRDSGGPLCLPQLDFQMSRRSRTAFVYNFQGLGKLFTKHTVFCCQLNLVSIFCSLLGKSSGKYRAIVCLRYYC